MQRRSLILTLVVCLMLVLIPALALADDEWSGYTAISDQEDLEAVANDMSGKYYLTNDIVLTGDWEPLGWTDDADVHFTGIFDGNGHTISGLYAEYSSYNSATYVGLFAINAGTIRNLTLDAPATVGTEVVGTVAGDNTESGVIENCHVNGGSAYGNMNFRHATNMKAYGQRIGGLVGCNSGIITKCSSTAKAVGWFAVGGLVGINKGGSISECFAKGEVNWASKTSVQENRMRQAVCEAIHNNDGYYANLIYGRAGGFVGDNSGLIENCYTTSTGSLADVAGFNSIGGFAGYNSGQIINCYSACKNFIFPAKNSEIYCIGCNNGVIYSWNNKYIHPLVGTQSGNGSTSGCYYSEIVNGSMPSAAFTEGGRGISTSDQAMKNQETYTDWDFETVWTMDGADEQNFGLPIFGWQSVDDDESVAMQISGIEKKRLTAAPSGVQLALPEGITVNYDSQITFSGDDDDAAVTLLYRITVSGDEGAAYSVSDRDAVWVGGCDMEGIIPEDGIAEIFVIKTFGIDELNTGSLTNTASVEPGDDSELAEDADDSDTSSTDADPVWSVTFLKGVPSQEEDTVTNMPANIYNVKADETVNISLIPQREDYEFKGWQVQPNTLSLSAVTDDEENITGYTFTMPGQNVILTATWEATTAAYKVEHYLENLEGSYDLDYTEYPLYGKIGSPATATARTYLHYTVDEDNSILSGTIIRNNMENGEVQLLTLKVYYKLDRHTVVYTDGVDTRTVFEDQSYTVPYGAATPEFVGIPRRSGYIFRDWYPEVADTVTEDITYTAVWQKRNSNDQEDPQPVPDPEEPAVPSLLNGDDHFAYIVGYADNLIHPQENITRAEVSTIFYRLLKDEIRSEYQTTANNFLDTTANDWFNTAVSTMAELGIVNGYPNGNFAPNDPITRAEFAAIAARFDSSSAVTKANFTDIDGHWAETEISKAAAKGWVNGYTDNTFRPNQYITRAEAMAMINRMLNRNPETPADLLSDMIKWSDNMDTAKWYYLDVQEATNSHDYERKANNTERWTKINETPDWTALEK